MGLRFDHDPRRFNEAPRSKLRGITELNSEDFSEGEANPVASYGECQVQAQRRGKRGNRETECIGRSKGGLTKKIHARCDALGNPTGFP